MCRLLFLGITIISLISCRTSRAPSVITDRLPPGTIRMSDNLFIDKTEISNLDYREFLFWTGRAYGKNSEEYTSLLPDTTVWSNLNFEYSIFDSYYLYHPAYSDYPIAGVSYEQAMKYAKWRTDRVMEGYLIKRGILPYIPDSSFTIEKYYAGRYASLSQHELILTYAHYSLPDSTTFKKAAFFADSVNTAHHKSCKKRFIDDETAMGCRCFDEQSPRTIDPPINGLTDSPYSGCSKPVVAHLKGNVREMTNVKGVAYGSSFIDSCKSPWNIFRKDTSSANAYTGFRNMCEYRTWKAD